MNIYILYCEIVINNGTALTKLANVAPAPTATKRAGRAQQIKVDDEVSSAPKLTALSFILDDHNMHRNGTLTIRADFIFNILKINFFF